MKIAIVGAGITGLTSAFRLSQKGHQVTIFEKTSATGGLTAGFRAKNWDWSLEYFFHHLFTSDYATRKLIVELGLADKLFFTRPKTSIFYKNTIAQFDSPFSLFTFPHLNFPEKIRTGLVTLHLKTTGNWKPFENITAFEWLNKYCGEKTFEILWKPLLLAKFGDQARNISMTWFWARIKKRSAKLGYLEGGFQVLIDKLVEKIKENNGQVLLNHEIRHFDYSNYRRKFDRIIFTVPNNIFLKIMPNLPLEYKTQLQSLPMIGALNLIFVLKEKFLTDNTYWLNINEPNFPFVAVVEHTNSVNPKYYGGNHLLYVGGYYPQNHRYFKMNKEEVLKEFLPYLQKINTNSQLLITNYYLFRNQYAQPIIPMNYSRLIPSHKTPIPNVFLTNMQQIYPWDRGMNYAIELGEKIAHEIENS